MLVSNEIVSNLYLPELISHIRKGMMIHQQRIDSKPHMVMLVGNSVVGDSRVEKAAISAMKFGYDVTVVGFKHRNVHTFSSIGSAPVLRIIPSYEIYNAWVKSNKKKIEIDKIWRKDREQVNHWNLESDRRVAKAKYRAGRTRFTKGIKWVRPIVGRTEQISAQLSPAPFLLRRQIRNFTHFNQFLSAYFRANYSKSSWSATWPQIQGMEEAFLEALIELKPDIIHVHDRHPLSAADRYSALRSSVGIDIPWIYDAHEWLPGQFFGGPPDHKQAWLAVEKEFVQRASAVITVSEQLASKMKSRHVLERTPEVVVNAPSLIKKPISGATRLSLREECGISELTPLLVYVGKLAERRGIFDIVRALSFLPGYNLAFVCSKDPHVRRELIDLASELKVLSRMHILDYVPADSVTWYISSADIGLSPLHPTAAHHSALPTKIREYLHAGLPIVASSLRAQSAFLHETNVGVVHKPQDSIAIANSVKRVYENIDHFRSLLTTELLASNSWEREELKLRSVWRSLCPSNMEDSESEEGLVPYRVHVASNSGTEQDESLIEALTGNVDEMVMRASKIFPLSKAGLGHNPSEWRHHTVGLSNWRERISGANGIVLQRLDQIIGPPFQSLKDEVDAIRGQGTAVAFLTSPGRFEPAEDYRAAAQYHPSHDFAEQTWARYERQLRRSHVKLRSLEIPILTTNRLSARLLDNAEWCPVPVRLELPDRPISTRFKFQLLPGLRGALEKRAVQELTSYLSDLGHVVVQSSNRSDDELLPDFVIDTLGFGDYSEEAARALGRGGVLIGCEIAELDHGDVERRPGISTNPHRLVADVVEFLESDYNIEDLRRESFEYASRVHSGELTRKIVKRVLSADVS